MSRYKVGDYVEWQVRPTVESRNVRITEVLPNDEYDTNIDVIIHHKHILGGNLGTDDEYDGQPDEAQEWYDFDPDC